MTTCPAALNIRGEHFECDWPSDENGKHDGWAHANRVSQAIWTDDCEQFQTNKPIGSE